MNNKEKAFAGCLLMFSLLLSGCTSDQVFRPTISPTSTITYTPPVEITKEPERAPDGSFYPHPKAFLPSERGYTTGIRQLAADMAFTNKISSEAQSQLKIDSGNVDIVGFRLIGDKASSYYILVGDRSNDKFYSAFTTNKDGFYSPISRDGNIAFLPMTRQDRDGQTLIGFDVKGDLLLPPTFVYKNGILLFTDPKTGEKVEMSTWEDWAHKVLALLTKSSTGVIEPTAKPTEYHVEDPQLEKVQTLTPEQKKIIEDAQSYFKDNYHMDPNIINITFDKDGKEIDTDTISGRVIAVDVKRTFFDLDNTTGKDQLEDGSWVFNPNLMKRLADEGIEKTQIAPIVANTYRSASSSAAKYAFEMTDQNPAIVSQIEKQIGDLPDGHKYSLYPILIYDHGANKYSWGMLVGVMKDDIKKNEWVEGKRYLIYKLASGEVKYIPVYYPNYLRYRS